MSSKQVCLLVSALMATALAEPMALFTFSSESVDDIDACNVTNKVSCRRIYVNQDALNSGKDILVPGLDVIMRHKGLPDTNNVLQAYYTLQNSAGCWAVLSFTKAIQSWKGDMECSGKALKVRNCGPNCHVLVEPSQVRGGQSLDRQSCVDRTRFCNNLASNLLRGLLRKPRKRRRGFFRRTLRKWLRSLAKRLVPFINVLTNRLTSQLCNDPGAIGLVIKARCARSCGLC